MEKEKFSNREKRGFRISAELLSELKESLDAFGLSSGNEKARPPVRLDAMDFHVPSSVVTKLGFSWRRNAEIHAAVLENRRNKGFR